MSTKVPASTTTPPDPHHPERLDEGLGKAAAIQHDVGADARRYARGRARSALPARCRRPRIVSVAPKASASASREGKRSVAMSLRRAEQLGLDQMTETRAGRCRARRPIGRSGCRRSARAGDCAVSTPCVTDMISVSTATSSGRSSGTRKIGVLGQQVHVFRPAAEQMRRAAAMQAVAVVLQVLAHVVGIAVAAEMAGAAGDIGAGHDAVADLERPPFAVEHVAAESPRPSPTFSWPQISG